MTLDDPVMTLGAEAAPGVLLLHPWWGVTPAVRLWAEHLVAVGRRVLVPDLFGGRRTCQVHEAEQLAQAAIADPEVQALVDRCADRLAAGGRPWVAMGFSLGAFLACRLAARGTTAPEELELLYGGQPPTGPDVGTRHVELHVVPDDPWFPEAELTPVEEGFRAAGAEVVVHRYPGCGHWFAEEGSTGYDPVAATVVRDRVLDRLRVD
ncbi:dienelactone hydrolase family protein [Geodermatophilus sp. SYSU D00758]